MCSEAARGISGMVVRYHLNLTSIYVLLFDSVKFD